MKIKFHCITVRELSERKGSRWRIPVGMLGKVANVIGAR